jgi:hypothetical protein
MAGCCAGDLSFDVKNQGAASPVHGRRDDVPRGFAGSGRGVDEDVDVALGADETLTAPIGNVADWEGRRLAEET